MNKEDYEVRGLQREGVRAPACRKGTMKRGLKYTGERSLVSVFFLSNKIIESCKIFLGKDIFTLSECLVLPILVLLAVVTYRTQCNLLQH